MFRKVAQMTSVSLEDCHKPCIQNSFDIVATKRDIPGVASNKSWIMMYYPTNQTRIEAEYELFGLTSIIASVGGSMGLFLGFSCLDSAMGILEKVVDRFYK